MMRTSTYWKVLVLSLLAQAASVGAQAPSPAPPQLEKIEGLSNTPSTVTTTPDNANKITETKVQGRVTEVQVKSGKSTYYLKPNTPAGSALPGDGLGSANRGPQWKVMEFDLGKKKKTQSEQDAAGHVPPPPQLPTPAR